MDDIYRYVISKNLNITDLIQYNATTKLNHSLGQALIYNHITEIIIKRLKSIFGSKYDEFYVVLNEMGGIISGSFILQCILEEEWKSDIDIYMPTNNNEFSNSKIGNKSRMEDFFYDSKYIYFTYIDDDRELYPSKTKIEWIKNYFLPHHHSKYGYELQKNFQCQNKNYIINLLNNEHNLDVSTNELIHGYHLQTIMIQCNQNDMNNYIIDEYDFDICKNIFYVEDNIPQLYIHNLNDIINKKTKFRYTTNKETSEKRMKKYELRNFIFTK